MVTIKILDHENYDLIGKYPWNHKIFPNILKIKRISLLKKEVKLSKNVQISNIIQESNIIDKLKSGWNTFQKNNGIISISLKKSLYEEF